MCCYFQMTLLQEFLFTPKDNGDYRWADGKERDETLILSHMIDKSCICMGSSGVYKVNYAFIAQVKS